MTREQILARLDEIAAELKKRGISVKIDARDNVRTGFKFAEYELKGVPVRLAMGPRDFAGGTIELVRRDTLEKATVPQQGLEDAVERLLGEIQQNIYDKALKFRDGMITRVDTYDEFKRVLDDKGGFILAHWDGSPETEERIKNERRSGAFRSTPPPKRESASSAESLRTAASFLPGVIDVSLF